MIYPREMKVDPRFPVPISAVGVMIFKGRKVLLGKRRKDPGAGSYGFPGGKLEVGESFEQCAARETREECGIKIARAHPHFFACFQHYIPRQYTHVGIIAEWKSGTPKVCEPDKCESWEWYDLDKLPRPLFKGVQMALHAYRNKCTYFDGRKWSNPF